MEQILKEKQELLFRLMTIRINAEKVPSFNTSQCAIRNLKAFNFYTKMLYVLVYFQISSDGQTERRLDTSITISTHFLRKLDITYA